MRELKYPVDFKGLTSLEKPFECDDLIVLPENISYGRTNLDPTGKPRIYKKGKLICVASLGSTDGYCELSRLYLDENEGLETKCRWNGSKIKLKVLSCKAPKRF